MDVRSHIRRDEPDAQRKLRMKLAELELAEARDARDGHCLGKADAGWKWVPAFLERHYQHPLSLQRGRNAWAPVAAFLEWAGITEPFLLTHQTGHDYVAWRMCPPAGAGVKARSKNTALVEVKIFSLIVHEAVKRGLLPANPVQRLGIRKDAPAEKPEILPEEQAEIEKALEQEPAWMREAWKIAMLHGCRLREVAVPMSRVDVAARVITFQGKKDKLHSMPLHEEAVPLVLEKRRARAAVLVDLPERPSKAWHAFFKRLGMPHLCFHCTRVTVVSRLVRAGFSQPQILQYIGHASATVNRIYRRHRPADVAHLGKALHG